MPARSSDDGPSAREGWRRHRDSAEPVVPVSQAAKYQGPAAHQLIRDEYRHRGGSTGAAPSPAAARCPEAVHLARPRRPGEGRLTKPIDPMGVRIAAGALPE